MIACENGLESIAILLLEKGADCKIADNVNDLFLDQFNIIVIS